MSRAGNPFGEGTPAHQIAPPSSVERRQTRRLSSGPMGFMWGLRTTCGAADTLHHVFPIDLAAIADIAAKAIGVKQAALPVAAARNHKLFWRYA
jgi:hypothetical protein